jgi:cytochrome d ubiquinol oxidase subunit II
MGIDLPVVWSVIIGFGLMMYVVMDGFDLGIGILFPFVRDDEHRDTMVNTVAPVWDGNETWLVFGGASIFAAFPMAYSVILSALYLPLIFMLAGLIWRGVAFEFRFKADKAHKPFWNMAFAWGSYIATFSQGVALGSFINGFDVADGAFAGGALDCFTPFTVFTGLSLLIAYALLGSTWLILKTEGELQASMRRLCKPVLIAVLVAIGIVSLVTPLTHPSVLSRWFSMPNILFLLPVPVLVLLSAAAIFRGLKSGSDVSPFLFSLCMLFLGYSGLAISLWPNIIPPSISIRDAASSPESMGFTLVGALFIIPFILAYTAWSYYVFRGKVKAGEGYH